MALDATDEPRRAARLKSVLFEIERGFAEPGFSSADVARRLGVSRRYVQRLLRDNGASLRERVEELRLARAHALLASPAHAAMSVTDIALHCGFGDISYFTRRYRSRFGATATQTRGRGGPTAARGERL